MALHKLKLDENGIWLDNMLLQGVRSYNIHYNSNENIDELTLHMDTRSEGCRDFNSLLDQGRESCGSNIN